MPAPNPSVIIPAREWTKVLWTSFLFGYYKGTFTIPGIEIDWRRYSTFAPWYTWGTHLTSDPYGAVVAGVYCDFWFYSPVNIAVTWSPLDT